MITDNPIRGSFLFFPPVDNAAAWNLRLDDLSQRLLEAFPDSSAWGEGPLGPRPSEALSFEAKISEDVWLDGLASTPFEGMGSILIRDALASEAAIFAKWLRDRYAPAPDLVHFTSEKAMTNGDDSIWKVPSEGDLETITAKLQEHIDATEEL
ncbi:hypothetical protein [Streptomyces triculaminicus]|uniref:hypothetical protein n=1 Tax=Streptomyces triculaminicus TaxID=2816232 RepID=UPI0037CDEE29